MDILFLLCFIGIAAIIIVVSVNDGIIDEEKVPVMETEIETPEKLWSKCIGCDIFCTCGKGFDEAKICTRNDKQGR